MQFADTVIDQLWEVWRISQVDKCEKSPHWWLGDGGPGPAPAYTHFTWMWTMASASSKANIGVALCIHVMLKHPIKLDSRQGEETIICLFYKNQQTSPIEPSSFQKNPSDMTCKHIPFLYQWSQPFQPENSFIFLFLPVQFSNLWEKACCCCCFFFFLINFLFFLFIFFNRTTFGVEKKIKSQCLFQRSSNKKDQSTANK